MCYLNQSRFEIFMTYNVKIGGVQMLNASATYQRYGDLNLYRMGAMYMTPEYHKISPSLRKGYLRVVMRKPQVTFKANWRMYFDSFVPIVWLASASAVFACHLMISLSQMALNNERMTMKDVVKGLLNGNIFENNLNMGSARVFSFTMVFTIVLCHQYYNSVMTSFLTVRHELTPFDDLSDFKIRTDYRLAIMGHFSSFLLDKLVETNDVFRPLVGKIETIDHAQSGLLLPEPTIVRRLYLERLALLVDEETAEAIFLRNCSFRQTKLRIPMDYFHFGVFKKNPFYEMFSARILNMRESGVLGHVLRNGFYGGCDHNHDAEATKSQGLRDIIPVFCILAWGITVSLIALIVEKVREAKGERPRSGFSIACRFHVSGRHMNE